MIGYTIREKLNDGSIWRSIPMLASDIRHVRQEVVAGFINQPRCAVTCDGEYYGLDGRGKEITREQAVEIGLV